ncbi:septation ring formation regulator EzrA [Lactobacillus sp. LC28-10]|uniref:Septation ring formation regulator EzrA n=1 Tax=Secundilactobacillus angelensis TaxID=2722706 RepID=A0ABX1KWY1_9LACO|nr:septation ring formation regulator EzrA [Secundilactobacillus angelensis]MCH5462072.1 septation ring formation regulator EzrA [Secundilactobacillus angelensis]NLR18447.1 septation ring formation regulator EzrA [Secundilactobacillus angelensis]
MFRILIGVIILAIVIYAGILIYQQYLIRRLKGIDQQREDLSLDELSNSVDQVQAMSLTGKTLEEVQQLTTDFGDLEENRLPRLKQQVDDAINSAKQYRIFSAQQEAKKAEASLDVANQAIKQVKDQVSELKQIDAQHKQAVKTLEARYQSLRKTLLAKNFMYGDAIDGLETQLGKLEDDNDHFREVTSKGDHEEAAKLLQRLQADTDHLDEMLKAIPPLVTNLETEFPTQIKELKQGESELTAQGYQFPEADFKDQIAALSAEITKSKESLAKLDVDAVKQADTALSTKIDHFYDVMQKEMTAKGKVTKNLDYLAKFISHAQNQNSLLMRELERLNHNYTLDHQELETTREFTEQLRNIETAYQKDVENIHSNDAIYTEVDARQTRQIHDLTQIEKQQQEINDSVAGLAKEEEQANQNLQQFEFKLHSIRREVENLNLPGVAKSYLDYYQVVSDEIDKLTDDMNQVQIDMEDITKQLIMIQSDLDILTEKTNDLIDSAKLAEQLIQYANRYRMTHDEVATASQEAQRLFDEEYDYAKSLETIATVLDEVEPGSYKRLEDRYYQSKQPIADEDDSEVADK